MACGAALPLITMAGPLPSATTLSACRPTWSVGDWWTVDSQTYDRGENRGGATPGWLEPESWRFSVDGTNSVDGEACYQVSVKPQGQNRCPYWFDFSFRMSDLLVMRQELHQPAFGKTARAASAPVVESNYSKDEPTPFAPSDFPNLPVTVPHFAGGMTNAYRASTFSRGNGLPRAGGAPKCSRSSTASMTQAFHAGAKMSFAPPAGAKSFAAPAGSGIASKSGVITVAPSADKFERQNWDHMRPWHIYAEKWEFGDLVRKSWLSDYGHTDPVATPTQGGAK